MNTQINTLNFDYKDRDCNYCPTRPILKEFKNYTGSPEESERLRNHIANEFCHNQPSYSAQQRLTNHSQAVNYRDQQSFGPNQTQQLKPNQQQSFNQQQPHPTYTTTTPRTNFKGAAIESPFVDIIKHNQNDSNRPTGCCNTNEYICFKTTSPPILIQDLPCQANNHYVPCSIKNEYNTPRIFNKTNKPRICRNKRSECNRENCMHKTPESTCLYSQPCKAHCFNTPPAAGKRGA